MREKGKGLDTNNYLDLNYSFSYDMPCKKHPSSSSSGICAYCLKDRLVNLVCSECGEQRLSSCSCSDVSSSYRNSSCTGEIGSVGRISFLIENEKETKNEGEKSDDMILLRRSSSSCVEIQRSKNGFWKIKRLFIRNKKEKSCGKNDQKSEVRGVSRSRSLCSFRGGGEGSDNNFQSAKMSDVTGGILFSDFESRRSGFRGLSDVDSEPRNSGFRGLSDSENEPRKSGFRGLLDLEDEPRKSGFRGFGDSEHRQHQHVPMPRLLPKQGKGWSDSTQPYACETGVNSFKVVRKMGGPGELNRVNSVPNRSIFPVKETELSSMDDDDEDDPAFIDFKIDQLSSSESKREFSFAPRRRSAASCDHQDGNSRNEVTESTRVLSSSSVGGACRTIVNDKELKNGGKGSNNKGWKWTFFRQNSGRRSTSK
ncbi:hypothetical protein Leryth_002170 [Lithospermum erythrorhizon]|uniref:Uncharacterized protein n=1 Tax=Lithospermum erythrorhizon TaxID=34254 RepID=A0AAV3RS22_LITER|nr:hypothetical protein Leryth_002170 [Lithospermum erythrorhizon]